MNVKIFATLFLTLLMIGVTVHGNVNVQTNNLTVVAEYLQEHRLSDPNLVSLMIIREIGKLENKITELETDLDCKRAVVAFSARVRTSLSGLNIHQTVPFLDVITNIGGGYHQETSIFRCPFRGLYEFSVTIVVAQNGYAETELMAGGVRKFLTMSYGANSGIPSGGNYVILELQEGDMVYNRVHYPAGAGLIRGGFSTFSGRLIQKF